MKNEAAIKKTIEDFRHSKGKMTEDFEVAVTLDKQSLEQVYQEGDTRVLPEKIYPKIAAIHAGITRNHNEYPSDELRGKDEDHGVMTFTKPYSKPMLLNHWATVESTVGRIKYAYYVSTSDAEGDYIMLVPEVTSPEAITKILDERYLTVSIGCTVSSAICSICGGDILNDEEWCGHYKGEKYDSKLCTWRLGGLVFDECSFVAVPADEHAMVIDKGIKDSTTTVSFATQSASADPKTQFYIEEQLNQNLTEGGDEGVMGNDPNKTGAEQELNKEVETLNTTITTLNATIETQKQDIATKDSTITSLTEQVTTLTAKVNEYKDKEHMSLVEKLIDLRISKGKNKEEERETLKEKFSKRSDESLSNSVSDLQEEPVQAVTTEGITIPEAVKNPGIDNVPTNKEEIDSAKALYDHFTQ